MLDAELLEAIRAANLCGSEAVVETHLRLVLALDSDADMAKTVELGSDLANLGGEELVMPDDAVVAERAARRTADAV